VLLLANAALVVAVLGVGYASYQVARTNVHARADRARSR
jgi:hypothetical protein